MKRFYCTICRRIKRVRQYPSDITSQHSDVVGERIGTCARHSDTPAQFTPKQVVNIPVKSLQNKRRA